MSIPSSEIIISKKCSTETYQVGMKLSFTNNKATHEYCIVTVTPCLRRTSKSETRYRHNWNVHILQDDTNKTYSNQILPDDHAQAGVVSAGHFTMKENVWYQWGPAYGLVFKNDGDTHTIGVYLHCTETVPRYCPEANKHLVWSFKTAAYTAGTPSVSDTDTPVIPPEPKGIRATFDSKTRKLTYYWDDVNCLYVKVWSNWYDEHYKLIKSGYIEVDNRTTLSNADKNKGLVSEIIPEHVTRVEYQVDNYSTTGHNSLAPAKAFIPPRDCKVWVKRNGTWVKAIPWVKTQNGSWKKANKVYVKHNGVWKQTIM